MTLDSNALPIVHIVRRYGHVGGMESYVWNLTHSLANNDVRVVVICEDIFNEPHPTIRVIQVPKSNSKQRWKAMLNFRLHVSKTIEKHQFLFNTIIHSHERSLNHHVTTFHGPPLRYRWLSLLCSKRLRVWKYLEKQEITAKDTQIILPVSSVIRNQLVEKYPEILEKKIIMAWPGVTGDEKISLPEMPKTEELKFLFVGKEWKRKNLKLAVKIVEFINKTHLSSLDIYGPDIKDIPKKFLENNLLRFKGWTANIEWNNYHALLHPAVHEPFGMVISEARFHGIPVICSTECGATDIDFKGVTALHVKDDIYQWAGQAIAICNDSSKRNSEILWTWADLANLHKTKIYPEALSKIKETKR